MASLTFSFFVLLFCCFFFSLFFSLVGFSALQHDGQSIRNKVAFNFAFHMQTATDWGKKEEWSHSAYNSDGNFTRRWWLDEMMTTTANCAMKITVQIIKVFNAPNSERLHFTTRTRKDDVIWWHFRAEQTYRTISTHFVRNIFIAYVPRHLWVQWLCLVSVCAVHQKL